MSDNMQVLPEQWAAALQNTTVTDPGYVAQRVQELHERVEALREVGKGFASYSDMMAEVTAMREQMAAIAEQSNRTYSEMIKYAEDADNRLKAQRRDLDRIASSHDGSMNRMRQMGDSLAALERDHLTTSTSHVKTLERLNESQYALDERMGELEREWEERKPDECDNERLAKIEEYINYVEHEGVVKLSTDHNLLVDDVQELSRTTKAAAIFGIAALFVAGIALGRSL
jgi:head-tail adaptor